MAVSGYYDKFRMETDMNTWIETRKTAELTPEKDTCTVCMIVCFRGGWMRKMVRWMTSRRNKGIEA